MKPFRQALKDYIRSGKPATEAMRAVWRDVKAGRVRRPSSHRAARPRQDPPTRLMARERNTPRRPEIADDDIVLDHIPAMEESRRILDKMDRERFWPNVWYANERGNVDLLRLSRTKRAIIVGSWVNEGRAARRKYRRLTWTGKRATLRWVPLPKRRRENPGERKIYDHILAIIAERDGERYVHRMDTAAPILGTADGGLRIPPSRGRLSRPAKVTIPSGRKIIIA